MGKNCPVTTIDHVELYVGNAKQTAYVYQQQFGFALTAYRGLETGDRKVSSYLLEQGCIRLVVSSPLDPDIPMAELVKRHGDGVAVLAFTVDDAIATYHAAVSQGAMPAIPPTTLRDRHGYFCFGAIHGYGDTLLKFVERRHYRAIFAPGFQPVMRDPVLTDNVMTSSAPMTPLFTQIDHIVANVEEGMMNRWAQFFIEVLGFELLVQFDDRTITTGQSALLSKVLQDPTGTIKLPINEPGRGKKTSQVAEFLSYHHGPGVQHIALHTSNMIQTVTTLKNAGVQFLQPPSSYYEDLKHRVGNLSEDLGQLKSLGILIDRDRQGYLLQIFTQPLSDRPTLFFEIIQRRGATGFGEGNFKALFESIEREQEKRGNLV